ncbi:hypothetical protein ATZ33_13815 [Enterococcus silesiacus]|uniref:Uncharacterized protein n=1 Tax=Enterococcus silesiacus TaxID=332949 RepID=A0A0S3KDS7_9ENTE|nr:hypothetical protein [Enterococcus silesiacus]ALS02424.1 hypothetical protein ATZ33_13815 [Enterococcus silesiacus]OJG88180.1 hypothetical protein RV15_GL001839 [Enterococcus silesiacus]
MAFQTGFYKEQRDNYKKLASELKSLLSDHQKKSKSTSTILTTYKSQAPEMSASDLPSKHYVTSAKSIAANLQSYINKVKQNQESLTQAQQRASEVAQEYAEKYEAEKQREKEHNDAVRAEKKRKEDEERERRKNR